MTLTPSPATGRLSWASLLTSSVIASAVLLTPGAALGQVSRSDAPRPAIVVTGEGQVNTQPDTASINVGVVTEAETAKQALQRNNQAMDKLFGELDRLGIESKNRQTVRFDVSPQFRRQDRNQPFDGGEPQIIGYQVTNQLRIKVGEVTRLGEVLDAVVQAGSNRIEGIQFSVEDEQEFLNRARELAVEDAKAKANLYANAAGVEIASVLRIEEAGSAQPIGQPRMMMAESSTRIAAGEQTLSAQVQITFAIDTETP